MFFLLNCLLHFPFTGEDHEDVHRTVAKTSSGQDTHKTLQILQDVNTKLYIGTEVHIYQSKPLSL